VQAGSAPLARAGYVQRSAVEMAIEKDEKIAMQWLKKQG